MSKSSIKLNDENPIVDLPRKDKKVILKINLTYDEPAKKSFFSSFFSNEKKPSIDLAALIKLSGDKCHVVQALGDSFGNMNKPPYVRLLRDDAAGSIIGGEWIYVNVSEWDNIEEILIYSFASNQKSNWSKINPLISIYMPGNPLIETRMTDLNNSKRLCVIAKITNNNGSIKIERVNDFYFGQKDMDNNLGWGFNWSFAPS